MLWFVQGVGALHEAAESLEVAKDILLFMLSSMVSELASKVMTFSVLEKFEGLTSVITNSACALSVSWACQMISTQQPTRFPTASSPTIHVYLPQVLYFNFHVLFAYEPISIPVKHQHTRIPR